MAKKIQGRQAEGEAFKDGYYAASLAVEEILSDVRCDIENADLSDAAETAAKMAVEMVARLWYAWKREVMP